MHSRIHDSLEYLDRWVEQTGTEHREVSRIYEGFEMSMQEDRVPEHAMQEPRFYMPGLTAQPWWDADRFPWVKTMQNVFPAMLAEFEAVGGVRGSEAVKHPAKLDDEGRWSAYYFFYVSRRYADHERACPQTAEALSKVPGSAECGMAYFSLMDPHTHVMAHSGFTNTHLRCHLGLVVPKGCRIRVGPEVRDWAPGRVNVFDDSFNHEVWNESDESRAVLLFDTWHPDLTPAEIKALAHLVSVWRKFSYMDLIASAAGKGSPTAAS